MRFRLLLGLTMIVLLALLATDASAQPSGTIKFAYFTKPVFYIRNLVLEPLVITEKGRVKPLLAERWKWVDKRTLEVNLRKDVRFHDGKSFDAEVAKANFDFFKTSIYPVNLRVYFKAVQCKIIDNHTIRYILPFPDSLFLPQLTKIFQISPTKLKELSMGERYFWGTVPEMGPWGTGPFRMVKGDAGHSKWSGEIILRANNNYWDKRYPKVKKIILFDPMKRFGWPKAETIRLANKTIADSEGKIDVTMAIHSLTTRIAMGKHSKIEKIGHAIILGLFNMRKKNSIWRDIRLRKAANYAINQKIFRKTSWGNAEILPGLIRKGYMGYNPDLKPYHYNPQKAKALIREAGHKNDLKMKIILPQARQKIVPIIYKMFNDVGIYARIDALGIKTFVRKLELNILDKPIEQQDWDICLVKNFCFTEHPFLDIYRVYFEQKGRNRWITIDDALQGFIDQFRMEIDPDKQEELLRKCEEIVHEKALVLYMYATPNIYALNKKVDLPPGLENETLFLKGIRPISGHWSSK